MVNNQALAIVSGDGMKDVCFIPIDDLLTIGCPYCFSKVDIKLPEGAERVMEGCSNCKRAYIVMGFGVDNPKVSLNGVKPSPYKASESYYMLSEAYKLIRQERDEQLAALRRVIGYADQLSYSPFWHFLRKRVVGEQIKALLKR